MKKNLLKKLFLIFAFSGIIAQFISCGKNDVFLETSRSKSLSLQDSVRNRPLIVYNPTSEPMKLFPANKNGDILNHKELLKIKSIPRTLDLCDGYFIDESSYTAEYKGVYYQLEVFNNTAIMYFEYSVSVPANIAPSGSLGTVILRDGYTAISPTQIKTATPSFELLSTYYDAVLGSSFNNYKVFFYIVIPYDSFCDYNQYQVKLKIKTDCGLIESFTTSYLLQNFTPTNSYQPEYVYAYCSAPNTIHFEQVDILGSPTCHYPTLGSSPKYLVEYKLSSSSTWIALPAPLNYSATYLQTVSPGTYDYRYKGLLTGSPDRYSPYSVPYSVTVF